MIKLNRRLTDAEECARQCHLFAHGRGVYMYATPLHLVHEEEWMRQSSSLAGVCSRLVDPGLCLVGFRIGVIRRTRSPSSVPSYSERSSRMAASMQRSARESPRVRAWEFHL